MELIRKYNLIRHLDLCRSLDMKIFNLLVIKRKDIYIVYIEHIFFKELMNRFRKISDTPLMKSILATDDPKDIEMIMDTYEFANSKGAIGFEWR